MGCGSSLAQVRQNPHYLKPLDFKIVNIAKFDEVFARCEGALGRLVELNNAFHGAQEGFLHAAALLAGGALLEARVQPRAEGDASLVSVDLLRGDGDSLRSVLAEELMRAGSGSGSVKALYHELMVRQGPLADAAARARVELHVGPDGCIAFQRRRGLDADSEPYRELCSTVERFNASLLALRAHAAPPCPTLAEGVRALVVALGAQELALSVSEQPALQVSILGDGLDHAPLAALKALDALRGLTKTANNVRSGQRALRKELEWISSEVHHMPSNAKEAVASAGMGGLEMVAAVRSIVANAAMCSRASSLLDSLVAAVDALPGSIMQGLAMANA